MDAARLALALALVGGTAWAHADLTPKSDVISVGPDGVAVAIDYRVVRGDVARALREIFDNDKSGTLEGAEREAVKSYLRREATAFLSLSIDNRQVTPETVSAVVDTSGGPDEALSLYLLVGVMVRLKPGSHRIILCDRHKDRRIPVDVIVDLREPLVWRKRPLPKPSVDEQHPLELEVSVP